MKKVILVLAPGLLLFLALSTGFYGWPAYRLHKRVRTLEQARVFLSRGDLPAASIRARQVLQSNPRDADACELMAQLAELVQSPAAIDWRLRIAQAVPSLPNRLRVVSCSLRFERSPFPLAARTLEEIAPQATNMAAFHALAAQLCLKTGRPLQAAEHLRSAERLEPSNVLHRFNLAALNLQSPTLATTARAELESFTSDPKLAPLALRWLVADALRGGNLSRANELAERLVAHPAASLEDRLAQLTVIQGLQARSGCGDGATNGEPLSGRLADMLAALQVQSSKEALQVYAVCEWMGSHGLTHPALRWVSTLQQKVRQAQPVRMAVADLYLGTSDWRNLERFLSADDWRELEFLRLAMLARAAWALDQESTGNAQWRRAVYSCRDKLGALALLCGLAEQWGRSQEEPLLEITRRFPREQWAFRELESRYFARGNTRGLNTLLTERLSGVTPQTDITNQNNLACTSLLLGVNLPQAHQLARELYASHPNDAVIASTFAYSLRLQNRPLEALAVLARFDEATLECPSVALYYGAVLAAAGQRDRAERFLALAANAVLLPEERVLLEQVLRR